MNKTPLYKNTYRVPSARWPKWNYAWPGYYFITICTKNRICYFGCILQKQMVLSSIGKIIHDEWLKTGTLRPTIRLDEWIIMPNHFHAIVQILESVETPQRGASTKRNPHHHPQWSRGSLGAIINQFKSACTKQIRAHELHSFQWQSRYHDHVIRNEYELNRIRRYIQENPKKWEEDSLFPAV